MKHVIDTKILELDKVFDLSESAFRLYMVLLMYADNNGFLPLSEELFERTGAMKNYLPELVRSDLIYVFRDGQVAIRDFHEHNAGLKRPSKSTGYEDDLSALELSSRGRYFLKDGMESFITNSLNINNKTDNPSPINISSFPTGDEEEKEKERIKKEKAKEICEFPEQDLPENFDSLTGEQLIETIIRQRGDVGGSAQKIGRRIKELERIYGIRQGSAFDSNRDPDGATQADIQKEVGLGASTYARYRKLADAIPELAEAVDAGRVTQSSALAMMKHLSEEEQEELISQLDATKKYTLAITRHLSRSVDNP